MPEQDAEQAWKSASEEERHTTDPEVPDDTDDAPDLQAAIKDAYAAIDDGDTHENLTVRDENLAALIHGLDEAGELGAIASEANEVLGRDHNDADVTRASVLKALIRVGLDEVRPDAIETAVEAKKEHQIEQTDEF